jgi:hypothetical protein
MSAGTRRLTLLTLAVLLAFSGDVRAQSDGGMTFWKFLGIPQGYRRVRDGLSNRRGNRPWRERKPPVKRLADPANLESDVKPIKAAAEIKQAEDLKQQKIKAIKYLAEIGCGCYDKDGKVSDALAAAMDDCTEAVRLATVEAIMEAAQGEMCSKCGTRSCCKEKVVLQLARLAYERDDKGCWIEPSERVRQAAAQALEICCPGRAPIEIIAPPEEVDEKPIEEPKEPIEEPEAPGDIETPEDIETIDRAASELRPFQTISASRTPNALPAEAPMSIVVSDAPPASDGTLTQQPPMPSQPLHGAVVWVDLQAGYAHVHFGGEKAEAPLGKALHVFRRTLSGELRPVGQVEIIKSVSGGANVRGVAGTVLSRLRRGDTVVSADDRQASHSRQPQAAARLTLVEWLNDG